LALKLLTIVRLFAENWSEVLDKMSQGKKNAFMCFVTARMREEEITGVTYPNGLSSAVDKYGPEWRVSYFFK